MHFLVLKLDNLYSSYGQSKIALKQANFVENTRAIAHAFSSKMEDLDPKAIIDLNTPSCSSIKDLLNAHFSFEIRQSLLKL